MSVVSVADKIIADVKAAMKSGDKQRLSVLRTVRARMQEAEVELRARKGRDATLDDDDALVVLAGCAKQRKDSIDSFRQAGREDLAAREQAELEIIQEYLPRQLAADEIRAAVREAIAATGAASPRDLGKVMQAVMPRLRGAADGKEVSRIARELLAGGGDAPAS